MSLLFNGGNQDIVEGSVVWLYCEVDSVNSTVTVDLGVHIISRTVDFGHACKVSYINIKLEFLLWGYNGEVGGFGGGGAFP